VVPKSAIERMKVWDILGQNGLFVIRGSHDPVIMKITALWNVMPSSLIGCYVKVVLEEHVPSVIMAGE
jgi:hypothetical protein